MYRSFFIPEFRSRPIYFLCEGGCCRDEIFFSERGYFVCGKEMGQPFFFRKWADNIWRKRLILFFVFVWGIGAKGWWIDVSYVWLLQPAKKWFFFNANFRFPFFPGESDDDSIFPKNIFGKTRCVCQRYFFGGGVVSKSILFFLFRERSNRFFSEDIFCFAKIEESTMTDGWESRCWFFRLLFPFMGRAAVALAPKPNLILRVRSFESVGMGFDKFLCKNTPKMPVWLFQRYTMQSANI